MQNEFINGKDVAENILLIEKIVHFLNYKQSGDNVLLKLEIEKTYDMLDLEDNEILGFKCLIPRSGHCWFYVLVNRELKRVFPIL